MTSIKKTAIAVTAGVWVFALGSSVALIYGLNGPLHAAATPAGIMTPFAATLLAGGWLALTSGVFGWPWKVRGAPEFVRAYAPAGRTIDPRASGLS